MKKYNITVNGVTYEVLGEEAGAVASAPVYTAPAAAAPAGSGPGPASVKPVSAFSLSKAAALFPVERPAALSAVSSAPSSFPSPGSASEKSSVLPC